METSEINDDNSQKIEELVNAVEMLDGQSQDMSILLESIDDKLNELSNGTIRVRYWVVDGRVCCTPVYQNKMIREEYSSQIKKQVQYKQG